jgi:hypothetical protein
VAIYAAGAHPGVDKPVLTMDIDQTHPATFVLYLHGTPSGGSPRLQRLAEVPSTVAEVVAPAATPGKLTLSVDTQAIGDEGDTAYPANYFTFGSRSACLKAVDDQSQGKATAFKGGSRFTFTLNPGDTDVGFWLTTATLSVTDGDLTCQGTEMAAVDVSHLTAGSLAWVFLFGPTATNLHALVVPFLS